MAQSDYVIRGGAAGRERLRTLARVMQPTTVSLLERVGLPLGAVCLDVGCGGGDVSREIARAVGAGGRVLGIDIDAAKLELARGEVAEAHLAGIEFRLSGVEQLAGEAQFDVAYARFVLTHLRDPATALARMVALLRPGGVVIVEDIDFNGHFCHPDSAAFQRYMELYTQVVRRRGADPTIGPRLPGLLVGAGCERVHANVVQPAGITGEVKLIAAITVENIADSVLAEGLAARAELDAVIHDLYALAADDHTFMSLPRVVQAWGYRAG